MANELEEKTTVLINKYNVTKKLRQSHFCFVSGSNGWLHVALMHLSLKGIMFVSNGKKPTHFLLKQFKFQLAQFLSDVCCW